MKRPILWLAVATLAALSGGCGGKVHNDHQVPVAQRPVAKDATKEELLDKYNAFASAEKTISATVELKTTAGSQYSGLIQEYHEIKAFLLAARPAEVRMVGQAPLVGKTIFDMASDGKEFHVWLPTKNKFLVGEVAPGRVSEKPLENLRPQHLLDALMWPEIRKEETVLFQEFNDENGRYYVLTVLRGGYTTEIYRTIWFDRTDLNIWRVQAFGPKGVLLSDAHFSDWQPVAESAASSANASGAPQTFPHTIRIDRPHDDYHLDLQVSKVELNDSLPADRFQLAQPQGSELVRVENNAAGKPPASDAHP